MRLFRTNSDTQELPPNDAPGGPVSGQLLGDFELVRWIASGGMGQVWEAKQVSLGRTVAVKLLLNGMVADDQLNFFLREGRAGGRLNHPNIVQTIGQGTSKGLAWIAQEFVAGSCTLKDVLDDLRSAGDVPPPEYYRLVAQFIGSVAGAMQLAHEAGVIHRDIKPQNILVTADDQPKVTDFGLAKIMNEVSLSHTGDFAGTYYYMSPEQVAARRMGIDHATDIFSLGVVLYELLTLRRPFEGDTGHQICEQIVTTEPPDPRSIRSQCPKDLSVICTKALEKARADRYASMAGFASDLRRYLVGEPILAQPPGVYQRVVKWSKRNRAAAVAAFAGIVALLSLSLAAAVAIRSARSAHERREELSATNDELARQMLLSERRAYEALMAGASAELLNERFLEAKRLHELCPIDQRNWEWRYLGLELDRSLRSLDEHDGPVQSVAWSPDGQWILSASSDGRVLLWDAEHGEVMDEFEKHDAGLGVVAWSPDGARWLAGGGSSLQLRSRSAADPLLTIPVPAMTVTAAWSPDGRVIATGASDACVRVWDALEGTSLATLRGHRLWVWSVAWAPDGLSLASGSGDGTVRLWDVPSGSCKAVLVGHETTVSGLAWSPDGSWVASGSGDRSVRLWDATTGECVKVLACADRVTSVAWSPYGEAVVVGSQDGSLRTFDPESGEWRDTLLGHAGSVESVHWSPTGNALVSGSLDETVRIWRAESSPVPCSVTVSDFSVRSVAWSDDGSRIATASQDGTVRLWDAQTGDGQHVLEAHGGDVRCAAWSPYGERLVSCSTDGALMLWDTRSGGLLRECRGHTGRVLSVAWSPDGSLIASGSEDQTVALWDAETGDLIRVFNGHQSTVTSVDWSSDSSWLVSASLDRSARIWSVQSGDCTAVLEPADERFGVLIARWSPNDRYVAVGGHDRRVRIWDTRSDEVRNCEGHLGSVEDLAWSPDGTRLASCSEDGTLRVWDPEAGRVQKVLKSEAERTVAVTWSPDGRTLGSASANGTLTLWQSTLDDAVQLWAAQDIRRHVEPRVVELLGEHLLLAPVLDRLVDDPLILPGLRQAAATLARARRPSAHGLNDISWSLVSPDRDEKGTDLVRGLRLARHAAMLMPDDSRVLDTLAWALFANGIHVEALAAADRAVEHAPEFQRAEFLSSRTRLQELIGDR